MKYPISILLIFVVLMTAWGLSQPPEGYTLSWSDEFDGKAVDTHVWHFRLGVSKESFQRAENVSLSGGMLRIAQKKRTVWRQRIHGWRPHHFEKTGIWIL